MRGPFAVCILALSLSAAPAIAQTTPNPPPKPKKVWTNDDLAALRGFGGVSEPTVQTAPSGQTPKGEEANKEEKEKKEKQIPREKDPKYYRQKLEPLRTQLAAVEAELKTTRDGLNDPLKNGSNAINLKKSAPMLRPEDELVKLEAKKKQLEQQIDDLETEARRNGVYPGDIR
jgi:hypothetical protein